MVQDHRASGADTDVRAQGISPLLLRGATRWSSASTFSLFSLRDTSMERSAPYGGAFHRCMGPGHGPGDDGTVHGKARSGIAAVRRDKRINAEHSRSRHFKLLHRPAEIPRCSRPLSQLTSSSLWGITVQGLTCLCRHCEDQGMKNQMRVAAR